MTDLKLSARKAFQCLDLTSLNDNDTNEVIIELCKNSSKESLSVGAVCIYPKFVKLAKSLTKVPIATVVNFPHGSDDLRKVVADIKLSVADGADEIDTVVNYKKVFEYAKQGLTDAQYNALHVEISQFVKGCKEACDGKRLKVIIESGYLEQNLSKELAVKCIQLLTSAAVSGNCDFVKTSTGKVELNATEFGAETIITQIRKSGKMVGFKAAGGIKTVDVAQKIMNIAEKIMGSSYISPQYFRIGASSLLKDILNILNNEQGVLSQSELKY